MSSKSRHGKRKHSRSKRKERQVVSTVVAQQPGAVQMHEPVPASEVAKSSPVVSNNRVVGKTVTPAAIRYPYVVSEMRRIGILSGIILVILVILSLVLS